MGGWEGEHLEDQIPNFELSALESSQNFSKNNLLTFLVVSSRYPLFEAGKNF